MGKSMKGEESSSNVISCNNPELSFNDQAETAAAAELKLLTLSFTIKSSLS